MICKIPCHLIQDLLPVYADGLTSRQTAQDIEGHLENCAECRESYEKMKAAMGRSMDRGREENRKEIDYVKTVKSRDIRNIICAAAISVLVILTGIGAKLFVIGSPSEAYMTTYIDVDEKQIHIGGAFWNSALVYSSHKLVRQKDGTQKLVVYACLASKWNRNGVFNLTLDREDVERQVDIGGTVVKSDGTLISKTANELYKAKNPFIGDASASGRLTGILQIEEQLGGFKNELQTVAEPYGWTLRYEDNVRSCAAFESRMKDYGCVLLALIDNLGEITWIYTAETEEGTIERETVLTVQEASEYLNAPVKSFGESPEKVQELLDKTGLFNFQ